MSVSIAGDDNDHDEFALPPPPPTTVASPSGPVEKSRVEIVSSAGQAQLRTPKEHTERLLWLVGDLSDPVQREQRASQELCWTTNKQVIEEYYLPPPVLPNKGFLVNATNGVACYAFCAEGPEGAAAVYGYFRDCVVLEQQSTKAAWNWRIKHVFIKSQAAALRSHILSVAQRDVQLATVAAQCVERLERIMTKLPETLEKETPHAQPSARPGPLQGPSIHLMRIPLAAAAATTTEAAQGVAFAIWSCNALDAKNRWTASRCVPIQASPGTIPCMAVSSTHMVVLWQPVGSVGFRLRLLKLSYFGRPLRSSQQQEWMVDFALANHFVDNGEGMLSLSLSEQGVCCVGCSNAVWVANVVNAKQEACIIVLHMEERRFKRNVTCALHQQDCIIFATAYGECYEIDWQATDEKTLVKNLEHVLACEPIYAAYLSNRRLLLQTAVAMAGRLIPYHSPDFFYMPSGRVLANAVCGTLLFVLEKYGSLLVYSAVVRGVIHPFEEPPKELFNAQGLSETLVAYRGVHASCERVIVLYPNGLIRVLRINAKMARTIAEGK
jgi:hypothetical protein